jgi:hypothetical protein
MLAKWDDLETSLSRILKREEGFLTPLPFSD